MNRSGWEKRSVRADTTGLKDWARQELGLADDTTVMVSELACTEPGCPPSETVVSVFPDGQASFLVKVAKPMAEVQRADLAAALAGEDHQH